MRKRALPKTSRRKWLRPESVVSLSAPATGNEETKGKGLAESKAEVLRSGDTF